MSTEITVGSDGQVTLSREELERLGVRPGDRVVIDQLPTGVIQVRRSAKRPISDAFGALKREGQRALTIEEIREIADAGWAGER